MCSLLTDYTEDALVEKPAIALFQELSWDCANCYDEIVGPDNPIGRETTGEVVLLPRLRESLQKLNPEAPPEAIDVAIEELTRDRGLMSPVSANREVYLLLKNGVKVQVPGYDESDEESVVRLKVIDWENPPNNNFFLASQFWVTGDMYVRRPDLVGFINGIPLVFIELKAPQERVKDAYDDNLRDYKNTIPQLFWYNGFIILSNGTETRIGTQTSEWDHFSEWKKINSEGEEGIVSLDTVIRGTCEPSRLLDILENFILYSEARGGLSKMIAKNHQYLGVNSGFEALQQLEENEGRLGVFWHTQGSGKSYSMVFFSQKALRKLPGNYTFVIVTDRKDLDGQIYKNFAGVGAVIEKEEQVRASSGEHLKQLLKEDHRYVFTLVQKFHTDRGEEYPKLTDRSDIIVITDEAHRSQYDTLAMNMRNALPNAAFIAFTGTPLIVGEEKTRQVFGDYVSIYNFKQSVDDKSTVPLYYENRIPELQLANQDLNEDMERLLEDAELDEAQEKKLEREFAREYHLITRGDRLERIAEDIVSHFMGRGNKGKAMVISIDKATAVKMYDKVQKYWMAYKAKLIDELDSCDDARRSEIEEKISFMEKTDMAVVVSQSQNEVEDLAVKGVDIVPHRKRMVTEDLDTKFKDPDDPFRIVFLCAMWMTGFDVPSCSTIYLDKPMRNHTLMQAIARANRVYGDKTDGLIVDYVGVFRSLEKALAIYGTASGGGVTEGETPIKDKSELVELLRDALRELEEYCESLGIDVAALRAAGGFECVKLLDDAVEAILVSDGAQKKYISLANHAKKLYKAILPDPMAREYGPQVALFWVLAKKIRSLVPPADISEVMEEVEALLDESIVADGYEIYGDHELYDLSKIDFEALKAKFQKSRKRTETEKLKGAINSKLKQMVRVNRSRVDFLERFQKMIEEYNAGAMNIEELFKQLLEFTQELNEEEQRGVAEQLSEEELAVFDLLTRPGPNLNKKEEKKVKKVVRDLLATLKRKKLVLDWRKRQQSRAAVRLLIEDTLDRLPAKYSEGDCRLKSDVIYQHIYDSYYGEGKSIYVSAA